MFETMEEYENHFDLIRKAEMLERDRQTESFDIIEEFVKENIFHFRNAWHFGDGNGGAIWMAIQEIVDRTPDYISRTSKNNKKKISAAKRKRVFENDKYRCLKCGTHKDLSIDHIIPESKGGSSNDDNLQTLCLTCNKSKGTKDNERFMKS